MKKVIKFMLPVDIVLELFDQLVIPVMFYGSEVWCFPDITHIEVLYRKFLKELLGVNRCTTNAMVYGDTGTMPVSKLILSRATNYFMKICNGKRTKLSYIMYTLLRCKQENHPLYQSHWLNYVEQNLSGIGMRDLWLSEGFGFTNDYVKHAIKLRQKDMYFQEWSAEMNTKKVVKCIRWSKLIWA